MISKFFYRVSSVRLDIANLRAALLAPLFISVASLITTGTVLGLRQLGGLQPLELLAFDQMVRLHHDAGSDSRLLVVTITEADIRAKKRWPLSDQVVAQLLQELQLHKPKAIGLDIYRDLPQEPGHQQLVKQLQAKNVITITKISDAEDIGVPPPPNVPEERVGFNDISSDPDGVIRRNLLFADSQLPSESVTFYSFSLRLALAYLQDQGISPTASPLNPEYLQLGKAVFIPLENNSGGYQRVDAQGYQVLLNYRSDKNVAPKVTLTQVLSRKVDPALIKDKVVLIGATANSAKDIFLTPYSTAARENPWMPGVEVHAQSVSQILSAALNGDLLFWFWHDWLEILWIGSWALVGGSLAWCIRHPLLLGTSGVLGLLLLLSSCFSIFMHRGWVPIAAPTLAFVMTGGVMVAYRAYQAQRQQQIVMTLLGQNTSPEIAKALWRSRDRLVKSGKLPGQRLTATMLFTDIRNFSTISEQMPPESLLDWLNEYLEAITHEVKLHQGIINKFTGDGLLAVFGVPVTRSTSEEISEDAQHAVACALAMSDRLQELNQRWKQQGIPSIAMRVGIFTGVVVVGSLGGKDRLEYGVIGDSVNIASRLESYDKDRQVDVCRILIAYDTLVHVQHHFQVEPWGPLALKGKHQTVDVYRVVGHAPPTQHPSTKTLA